MRWSIRAAVLRSAERRSAGRQPQSPTDCGRIWCAGATSTAAELRAAGLLETGEEIRFVVNRMHDGQPLAGKIRTAWEGILEHAGLGDDVVHHSLRHTAATWLMQQGTDHWQAAGWLGMTVEQLEQIYGHHHPDFQGEAAEAFGGRR